MKQYFVLDVDLSFNNNKETMLFVLALSAKFLGIDLFCPGGIS